MNMPRAIGVTVEKLEEVARLVCSSARINQLTCTGDK